MVLCHKKLSKFWLFSMKFENMVAKHAMCFRFLNLIGAAAEDFLKKFQQVTTYFAPLFCVGLNLKLYSSMVMLQSRIVDWKFSCELTLWNCQTLFTATLNFFVKLKSKCLLKNMINIMNFTAYAMNPNYFVKSFRIHKHM